MYKSMYIICVCFSIYQAWPSLTPTHQEVFARSVEFAVYNEQIQELKSIIRQRLKGTQVSTNAYYLHTDAVVGT